MFYRSVKNFVTGAIDPDQIELVPAEGNSTTIPSGHRLWADYAAWQTEGNAPVDPLE